MPVVADVIVVGGRTENTTACHMSEKRRTRVGDYGDHGTLNWHGRQIVSDTTLSGNRTRWRDAERGFMDLIE
jgi:hypothetical protein